MRLINTALGLGMLAALTACGGGSGGGVNSAPAPTGPSTAQFTTFASVQSNVATVASGITREGAVRVENTGAILQSGVTTPTEGVGSATFTLNPARQITALQLNGAQSSLAFNSSNATAYALTLNGSPVATAITNTSGSDQAIFGDPYVLGFNYQNFGVWGTGLVLGSTGRFGAMSVGAKTNASSVPTSGSVTYRGVAGGIYTNGSQDRYAADATFVVNFASRSVDFSTSNQTLTSVLTNITSSTSMLSIRGTMNYSAGSSVFSGPLTANGQTSLVPLSGTGSGTFYGPTANEIGGTFFLRGPTTTLIGGFGGKQ